jgi:hypothetical protein
LLRVLLLWVDSVPANSGEAVGRDRRGFVLRGVIPMAGDTLHGSSDWVRSPRTNLLAWWIPLAGILAGLFVPAHLRAAIWIIALAWMGTACMLNAGRCGRTHCRYTGPYYLAAIAPVLVLASGIVSADLYGWLAMGFVILAGSLVIWWATERVWGKFS